jgi:hypothetical protein
MINLYNQVPTIYTSASRDFQYLSWLINIVLNSVKHNVDDMYDLPNTRSDARLTELLALTLGFKVKRNYDQTQLAALVRILPKLLKYKGTQMAINLAGEALIAASGSTGTFDYSVDGGLLTVVIPKELVDITLFMDLLPYILPAGMTCRVIRKTQIQNVYSVRIKYKDTPPIARWHYDVGPDTDNTNLSGLFDAGKHEPKFSNYVIRDAATGSELNTGLLTNTVIPVLDDVLKNPAMDAGLSIREEEE